MMDHQPPALPLPALARWQPLRLGLVELFHYDSEEFWFRDGHLLLRGNNGTGKSKVLSLTTGHTAMLGGVFGAWMITGLGLTWWLALPMTLLAPGTRCNWSIPRPHRSRRCCRPRPVPTFKLP